MRILIDMQFCQHPGIASDLRGDTLALVLEILRQQTVHEYWIAFNARFPADLAAMRAAFAGVLPPERLVVYATPAPDGSARGDRMIALVYENFFHALNADIVFTPGLGAHAATLAGGPWGGGQQLRAWAVAALDGLGSASLCASLCNADLLLAYGPGIAEGLRASLGEAAPPPSSTLGEQLCRPPTWHARPSRALRSGGYCRAPLSRDRASPGWRRHHRSRVRPPCCSIN